ncbi:hypothetical protein M3Y94_00487700 [Aphelenchoides besseyi]|nr:hypothetical protein M3Y94_00487700 [Aphelenchoides besseyi]KAI6217885.1 ADP-ribosylation factor-related protein 1 isoform X1 [Aphelenchoides besseyi]
MFALGAGMFREMTKKNEYFVLVCGPESSGKTTFSEQFRVQCDPKFHMPKRSTPTIGLNLVKFDVDGFVLNFWDVGGNEELISMWDKYIEDCHAIVFVVDSCAENDQFEACIRALDKLMNFEHSHVVPLMIVFNKCDLLDIQTTSSEVVESKRDTGTDTDVDESRADSEQNCSHGNGAIHEMTNDNNGWTSQDEANYEVYRAYGWEKPDFVPPPQQRTPSQCSLSTNSSSTRDSEKMRNFNKNKTVVSRAQQSQRLRDVCQEICESVHRADMAVFSISALKATNIQRCRNWLSQQLLTFGTQSAQSSTVD